MKSGSCTLSRINMWVPVIIAVFMIAAVPIHSSTENITGGRQTIPDPQGDKDLLELSHFAINQYNSNIKGSRLEFVSLVSAEQQVVSGILYYLTLRARSSGSETHEYEAQVWVQPWRGSKSLEAFTLKQ